MTKYEPLEKFLYAKGVESIPMKFSEIESVIQDNLPPSARKHRAWWSNNPSNSVITYAWLAAGYKTSAVNLESEHVVFLRKPHTPPQKPTSPSGEHPLLGCMAGSVTFADGTDITEPAMPVWADDIAAAKLNND